MSKRLSKIRLVVRAGLVLIILAIGLTASLVLIRTGPKPEKRERAEREQQVRAIRVPRLTVRPKATGYGQALPSRQWDAVAQVSGKVTWQSERLQSGRFFKKGDLLLKLDASKYELNIRKSEADVKKSEAKIQELRSTQENLKRQLGLQQQTLAVNRKNLERQKKLLKSNVVAAATVEEEEISVLQEENSLENIQSTLNLLPAQIAYEKAELAAAQAELEQSKLDLAYTKVTAPFDCIIDTVSIEEQQYVGTGQTMVEVDGIDKAEITAQFSLNQLAMLIGQPPKSATRNVKPAGEQPPTGMFPAHVKCCNSATPFSWPAKFERFASGMDSATRMVSVVVSVNQPYALDRDRFRPPLLKGLFCEVEITGRSQSDLIVIPRHAIHDDRVYLVDENHRLRFRNITVSYYYGSHAIIAEGLDGSETLITSDLLPAVEGMKVKAVIDTDFAANSQDVLGSMEES